MVPALHPVDVPVHHAVPDVKTVVKQCVQKHVQMNVKDKREYLVVHVQLLVDKVVLLPVTALVLILVCHHVIKYVIQRLLLVQVDVALLRDV